MPGSRESRSVSIWRITAESSTTSTRILRFMSASRLVSLAEQGDLAEASGAPDLAQVLLLLGLGLPEHVLPQALAHHSPVAGVEVDPPRQVPAEVAAHHRDPLGLHEFLDELDVALRNAVAHRPHPENVAAPEQLGLD